MYELWDRKFIIHRQIKDIIKKGTSPFVVREIKQREKHLLRKYQTQSSALKNPREPTAGCICNPSVPIARWEADRQSLQATNQ